MWSSIYLLAQGCTNVTDRPENYYKWKKDKAKQNRDKTARRGWWTCRSHHHLLRLLNQNYWVSPRLSEICRLQSGCACSCNKTPFQDCLGYSKDVFRCPMGRMFSRFREVTGDSAVTGFLVWVHTWIWTWSTAVQLCEVIIFQWHWNCTCSHLRERSHTEVKTHMLALNFLLLSEKPKDMQLHH